MIVKPKKERVRPNYIYNEKDFIKQKKLSKKKLNNNIINNENKDEDDIVIEDIVENDVNEDNNYEYKNINNSDYNDSNKNESENNEEYDVIKFSYIDENNQQRYYDKIIPKNINFDRNDNEDISEENDKSYNLNENIDNNYNPNEINYSEDNTINNNDNYNPQIESNIMNSNPELANFNNPIRINEESINYQINQEEDDSIERDRYDNNFIEMENENKEYEYVNENINQSNNEQENNHENGFAQINYSEESLNINNKSIKDKILYKRNKLLLLKSKSNNFFSFSSIYPKINLQDISIPSSN